MAVGGHLGQNLGIWPPQGDHKEAYPPGFRNSFLRIMTILYTKCILWLFYMIKSSKLVSYCHNTHILCKIWVFDLLGWPYRGLPPGVYQLFVNNYEHTLHQMCFCDYLYDQKVKLVSYCHNTHILIKIWPTFWYLTPRGDHKEGYLLGFSIFFSRIMHILYTKCIFVTVLCD